MKIFGIELVRVVEVPSEKIVAKEVPVGVPVYETISCCPHEMELERIRKELESIRKIVQNWTTDRPIVHYPDEYLAISCGGFIPNPKAGECTPKE